MPEIVTRAEAKARGLKRYFTGKPCGKGHISERGVAHPGCIECGRLNSARYKRENPEKYREARRRTHLKHRDKDLAVGKEWYRKNKAKHQMRNKEWAQRHRDKMRKYSRKSFQKNYEKEKARRKRLYYQGPKNPKGESQWRNKNLAQLRSVKRLLKSLHPARGRSPREVSTTLTDLLKSCPH